MKSYTDLERSKKLAKILPLESADMYWKNGVSDKYIQCFTPFVIDDCWTNVDFDYDVPCWSLAALFGVLRIYTTPTAFSTNISVPSLTKTKNGYSITYVGDYRIMGSNNNDIESPIEVVADNPVDACVEMVIKLHELNLL